MTITVVGSVALDTVETPQGKNQDGLGGAAVYFSLAAAKFTEVKLVGVVGDDFPQEHIDLLASHNIDLEGLEKVAGKTFRWSGRYHENINERDTLDTQLNVFEQFHPKVPESAAQSPFLFLGNIQPLLQMEVLNQTQATFIALDTMNLWIDIALVDLKKVLAKVNALIINDAEARQLTGQLNLVLAAEAIHEWGPEIVVIKKGEHGCLLFTGHHETFAVPALPLRDVVDPTGAGDSFAGGFMGYLAQQNSTDNDVLRKAVVYGSVIASFTCQAFGPAALAAATQSDLKNRYEQFQQLTQF